MRLRHTMLGGDSCLGIFLNRILALSTLLLMSAPAAVPAVIEPAAHKQSSSTQLMPLTAAELVSVRQRAESGDAEAQNQLGLAYLVGSGIERDEGQAAHWFRRAAEAGLAAAQNQLGTMYRDGRGLPKNREQALEWFEKAAEQGFAEAHLQLGALYLAGTEGAEPDKTSALTHVTIAAALASDDIRPQIIQFEERVAKDMTPAQVREAKQRAQNWMDAFSKRRK